MNLERFNKILVVDDSTANLQLLLNLLTEQGYSVYPASDGGLALEFVQTTLPDLILLDIKMPGMDGYEVCRRLKADARSASIPVIFLSALEDERDKVKGFQAGGVDYITKPFQPEEMLARVRIHLRIRELTEGLEQEVNARTKDLILANKQLEEEIAERRQAEEALRESRQRLDNIVANSPGAIYRCANDEHWTMEFISAGITQISGYPAEDFLDNRVRTYASIIHPDDRLGVADAVASGLARKEHYEMDYRLVAADGSLRWVHEQGRGVFAAEGQLLCLDGVIFDITAQRETEEALRLSSERLRLATRVASIGIWDWDVVRNELLWDDSMYQLYGTRKEDFGGAYGAWISTIHPEDRAHAEREIQAALRGEREYAPEFRIVWADGSIRHIKAASKTFRDRDGKPLRMIGTNIDITERKRAEETLQRRNEELERFERLAVGRELTMVELKKRVAQLEEALQTKKENGHES
jgi:PAS domain S-box-containing protein